MQMGVLKQKFSNFMDDAGDFISVKAPLLAFNAAMIYGGATFVATLYIHDFFEVGTRPLQNRSAVVFNQMADLQHLNDTARGNAWTESMKNITYDIRSDGMGWNWKVFNDGNGGRALIKTADNANIALIPHETAGKPATLTVDSDHGCLQVDFSKTDEENKDLARALLKTFGESRAYDAYGAYTVDKDMQTHFRSFDKGHSASSVCPAAPKALAEP